MLGAGRYPGEPSLQLCFREGKIVVQNDESVEHVRSPSSLEDLIPLLAHYRPGLFRRYHLENELRWDRDML